MGILYRTLATYQQIENGMITNVLWYVSNETIHKDLKVPYIKDFIKSVKHHNKLESYSNVLLNSLLEPQNERILKSKN